jgi:hypothetical protein
VTRLEHLVAVLLSEVHALVDDLMLHVHLLELVRVGRVENR